MTKKEAILTLCANVMVACERASFDSATCNLVEEALDMAIDALEQTDTHERDVVSRDKALNLVLDVCNDVMDECETVTGICGEEVYTDVREVDAILKCNKRIRNGIRRLPSEPVGISERLEWIPCSERLPSKSDHKDDMVLVCYGNGSVRFNTCKNGQWCQGNPLAWMPLPEGWKGECE